MKNANYGLTLSNLSVGTLPSYRCGHFASHPPDQPWPASREDPQRASPGLIHHSDRGSQYCSYDYQRLLKVHHMIPSMSGKGNCYDNAMVETVFKTIKSELVWRTRFQSRQHAENAIGRYIDGFYNPTRRHSALGYQSTSIV